MSIVPIERPTLAKLGLNSGHVTATRDAELHNAFVFAAKANANAIRCAVNHIEIDCHPISEIVRTCSELFGSIDRDDDFQRGVARDAWRLKTTLALTALPFDDPRLKLDTQMRSLEIAVHSVPEISKLVKILRRNVDNLISASSNPKRERLLEMVRLEVAGDDPIAIVANLHGFSTPGWPLGIDEQDGLSGQNFRLVRNRKDISDNFFSSVIIPGSPKFAPRKILFDLLYGGRSSQVFVLCYRAERAWIPPLARMPVDSLFANNGPAAIVKDDVQVVEAETLDQVDKWANDSFWDSLRHQYGNSTPTSDRDVRVRARFVLFADGSGAFLPEDGRVVEISDKFDQGRELDTREERLPRKSVPDLDEGDLVMMRLTGSGDYLDDVADDLMAKAGEDNLRHRALEWKDRLNRTLRQLGEGVVARKLRELNVVLRSPQYLWAWAGDAVMAPHDLATFLKLIQGIHHLDPMPPDCNVDEYARDRWNDMELVKAFHQKAGSAIRASLVSRVRDIISKRQRVDTVQTIELTGVKAGKMGLMRVSAVDDKSILIPLSRMFHLKKIATH
jgi:hypothetical protein